MTKKSYSRSYDDEGSVGGTAVVPPVNTAVPMATQADNVVNCTMGLWEDPPPDSYAYQWQEDGTDVVDATQSTHALTSDNVGHTWTCVVSATNDMGTTPVTSNGVVVSAFTGSFNPEAPRVYEALEDMTIELEPGTPVDHVKGDQVTMTYTQARKLIDAGVRIIGID